MADVPIRVDAGHQLMGRVIGMPSASQPTVDSVAMLSGGYLDPSDPSGVVVEQHMAGYFNLARGSSLSVFGPDGWQPVHVRGVAASAEYLWPARSRQEPLVTPDEFGVLFVPEPLAQSLSGLTQPNQALVYLDSASRGPGAVGELTQLATAHSAAEVTTRDQQASNATLQEDITGFGELSVFFPVLFLAAAAVATYLLLSRLVRAQRTQLGTLRGNGVRDRAIVAHYLSFGLGVGLVAGLIGALAGIALAGVITNEYATELALPFTVVQLHPWTPVIGLSLAIVAGAAAALAPSLLALKISPAEAMRGQVPALSGRTSLFEHLLPGLRQLPAGAKLVLRGLERNPRRSLTVIVGVALALVLVLTSLGLIDTTQILLARQFDDIQQQDAQVFTATTADQAVISGLMAVPGVLVAEPAAQLSVTLRHSGRLYSTALVGLETTTLMHRFYGSDGARLQLPVSGVLLGTAVGAKLGLHVGDVSSLTVHPPVAASARPWSGSWTSRLGPSPTSPCQSWIASSDQRRRTQPM